MAQCFYSLVPTAKKMVGIGSAATVVDAAIRLPTSSVLVVAGAILLGLAMLLRCEFVMERERHRHQQAMARLRRDAERVRQRHACQPQARRARNEREGEH